MTSVTSYNTLVTLTSMSVQFLEYLKFVFGLNMK